MAMKEILEKALVSLFTLAESIRGTSVQLSVYEENVDVPTTIQIFWNIEKTPHLTIKRGYESIDYIPLEANGPLIMTSGVAAEVNRIFSLEKMETVYINDCDVTYAMSLQEVHEIMMDKGMSLEEKYDRIFEKGVSCGEEPDLQIECESDMGSAVQDWKRMFGKGLIAIKK